jgi:hypothetical protein
LLPPPPANAGRHGSLETVKIWLLVELAVAEDEEVGSRRGETRPRRDDRCWCGYSILLLLMASVLAEEEDEQR